MMHERGDVSRSFDAKKCRIRRMTVFNDDGISNEPAYEKVTGRVKTIRF